MTTTQNIVTKKTIIKPKRSISVSCINNYNKMTNYELLQIYNEELKKLPYIIINKYKSNNSYELLHYLSQLEKLNINISNKLLSIYDLENKNNLMNIQNDLHIIINHTKTLL